MQVVATAQATQKLSATSAMTTNDPWHTGASAQRACAFLLSHTSGMRLKKPRCKQPAAHVRKTNVGSGMHALDVRVQGTADAPFMAGLGPSALW